MIHRITIPIAYLLAVLLLCGACQDDREEMPAGGNVLTLSLQTSASTRATVAGEDRFNENAVEQVDVFFFEENNGTAIGTCLYARQGLKPDGNTLQVILDKEIIEDGESYYIYVVANYDLIGNEDYTQLTLDDLKDITITTPWKEGYEEEDVIEESLVMDGATTVTIQPEGTSGHVDLTRAMAKVMLYVTTESEITDNGNIYTPVTNSMFATLVYGVNKTNLGDDYAIQSEDYITRMRRDYDPDPATEVTINNKEYKQYEQEAPFYSYPNPEETADRKDSYLILCVPWKVTEGGEGDGSYQAFNYYYRVPITGTDAPALLERNHYYKVNVHIGVLGSINPHEAAELKANFEILDWFDVGIDTDMQQYQYLVLDEYESVMNNVNELEMPYISSSPIDWNRTEITEVSYYDYKNVDPEQVVYPTRYQGIPSDYELRSGNGNTIIFSHTLTEDDYSAITIKIKVYNTQGVEADEWIITQYPAIYIEGERAEDRLYVAGYYSTYKNYDWWGNWDKDQSYSKVYYNEYNLGSVQNPESVDGTANNRNPNNYTIYVTSFDVGDNYAIGDPRIDEVDNLSMSDLKAYHPARKGMEYARVIAPAFKIASSRGKTLAITYGNAQRRCAAYQEDGYPAGRWRIPTEAEIEFVVGLSENNKIPALFDGEYWSASGRYYDSDDREFTTPGNNATQAVRCVYDVWYWGDEDIEHDPNNKSGWDNDDFIWGDDPDNLRKGDTTQLSNQNGNAN